MSVAGELLAHAQGKALIGDSGYDSDEFVHNVRRRGMRVVICCNPTRKWHRRRLDKRLYRTRFRVEVFFHHLKRLRAVATRYDKTARNYLAIVHLACALRWLN